MKPNFMTEILSLAHCTASVCLFLCQNMAAGNMKAAIAPIDLSWDFLTFKTGHDWLREWVYVACNTSESKHEHEHTPISLNKKRPTGHAAHRSVCGHHSTAQNSALPFNGLLWLAGRRFGASDVSTISYWKRFCLSVNDKMEVWGWVQSDLFPSTVYKSTQNVNWGGFITPSCIIAQFQSDCGLEVSSSCLLYRALLSFINAMRIYWSFVAVWLAGCVCVCHSLNQPNRGEKNEHKKPRPKDLLAILNPMWQRHTRFNRQCRDKS